MKQADRAQRYWADQRWGDRYNRTHSVYIAHGSDGAVLYVGCTSNVAGRAKNHRNKSRWWPLATRFTVRGPYFRSTAYRIERETIARLRPSHNVRGVPA